MAGITDCFDVCSLEENDDGLLQVRLDPAGGITCGVNGLGVTDNFYPDFEKADGEPYAIPGDLFAGIVNPTLPSPGGTPVTTVFSGAAFGLPSGGTWCVILGGLSNMKLLPPATGASEAGLSLLGSVDGVNYRNLHAVNYITDSAGKIGPAGGYQEPLQVYLAGGTLFTPTFVISYNRESAANDADFIKATFMRYWFTVKKVS